MVDEEILIQKIEEKKEEFVELRRRFHRIPELGFEEKKTTEAICECLTRLRIRPLRLEPTGVVGYIGPENRFTIALRADIDGLPIKECTGKPFQSEHPGLMHACGHDGHIAGLLGAASILKEIENQLTVRVKLIFQPSEENTLGAKKIIDQGVLNDVDAIFGLHLFSDMQTGVISVEEGPRMAQTDRFFINFYGKSGHAGKPHQCVDATVMASDFVMSVQTIVAREIDPAEGAVVTIGAFHSGTQYNIISGQASIEGTCRSFSKEVAEHLKEAVEKRADYIAQYYGGKVEIHYDFGSHPPVYNEEILTGSIRKQAQKFLGKERLNHIAPLMLGEDFSWYQTRVPGVFAFVGCRNPKEEVFPNHHSRFEIDESALKDAVALHLSAVLAVMDAYKQ